MMHQSEDSAPLAAIVLANAIASARIHFSGNRFTVSVRHALRGEVFERAYKMENRIGSDVFIDVRYFPKRAGVFQRNDEFRAPAA